MKEKRLSGAETPFKDINGTVIRVHDYVKDGDGNPYYINSHMQAVPEDGSDAPAKELERLVKDTTVRVMTIEEVLGAKPVEKRRRGGRRKADPEKSAEDLEKEIAAAKIDAELKAESAQAAPAAEDAEQALHPVTEDMILSILPDDLLAKELRRRGYVLCAVRPALIEL